MTTTPSTASQAPAVSIDTPEFLDLACKFAHESSCEEFNEVEYNSARAALVAHIDAKLAHERYEGQRDIHEDNMTILNLKLKADERATAAEAKLEAIRKGAEGLQEYSPAFKVIGGMAKSNDGGWLCKEELLALLQPQEPEPEPKVKYTGGPVEVRITRYKLADPAQPQADESGLPG